MGVQLAAGNGGAANSRIRPMSYAWLGFSSKTSLSALFYITYVVLVTIYLMDLLSPTTDRDQSVFYKTVRMAVQFWSVCLVIHLCRGRITNAFGSVVTNFAESARNVSTAGGTSATPAHRLQCGKTTNVGIGGWFSFASCEMQGWRPQMEDAVVCAPKLITEKGNAAALFAVFDGHGGSEVSACVAELLVERVSTSLATSESSADGLRLSVLDIEAELRKNNVHGRWNLMGCTAAVALLTPDSVTVVSVGDSRIFKCRNGRCVPLTRDHKPESPRERRRIEAAGGSVEKFGPCYRVDFCLNMSRALGDFHFKDPGLPPDQQKISPTPDVAVVDIDEQDEFIVVACDGLFELMTWDSVCDYVHQRIRSTPLNKIAEGLLDACCSPNMLATGGRGTDNESVVIIKLSGTNMLDTSSRTVTSELSCRSDWSSDHVPCDVTPMMT